MTKICDAPEDFASQALAGFADIYRRHVRLVSGGVLRCTRVSPAKVSLVIGGGSGHYPAFAGYVGPGLADAAVVGDVFASPSTAAIARICRQADHGGGILLGYGNYAGDVLNFGVAAERLRAEGIDVRTVPVTDDVASATADSHHMRRGIAGDLVVFKIAGAAAEAGLCLADVERIARHANDRTVSFGIAFDGCTLPGAVRPLFAVPNGQMSLGLGIHGEPGIGDHDICSARDLAKLLVGKLLAERPAGVVRVGAVLNGLGATKYEELFVLWAAVSQIIRAENLEIVMAECGEYVTSLDMAGCSLTLIWLDDELEKYWSAACDTPALRRGATFDTELFSNRIAVEENAPEIKPGSAESQKAGRCVADLIVAISKALETAEEELGRIDAIAGDGDHGMGMRRGSAAARDAANAAMAAGGGAATILAQAGDAWADRAGGTSGALWGVMLRSWSKAFSDQTDIKDDAVVRGARLALDSVTRLGRAKLGDKTLVDALIPFVEELEQSFAAGATLEQAWTAAAQVSDRAAKSTAELTPKLGRARPLAARSIGHPDAGATSLALVANVSALALQRV